MISGGCIGGLGLLCRGLVPDRERIGTFGQMLVGLAGVVEAAGSAIGMALSGCVTGTLMKKVAIEAAMECYDESNTEHRGC